MPLPAAEIIMFDNYVVVYKYLGDLMFYVTASQDENELIMYTVLQAFYESVSLLLRWARLPWLRSATQRVLARSARQNHAMQRHAMPVMRALMGQLARASEGLSLGTRCCSCPRPALHIRPFLPTTHRHQVEKKTVLENLDQVMLVIDEIIDGGWVRSHWPRACF